MEPHIVNKRQLSAILGKSEATLTTWQGQGMPIEEKASLGKKNKYDTCSVIDWIVNKAVSKIEGRYQAIGSLEDEKTRLTKIQADKALLQLREYEGELVRADDVEQAYSMLVANCKSKILALPYRMAQDVSPDMNTTQIEEMIKSHLYEALEEISEAQPIQALIDHENTLCSDASESSPAV